MHKKTRTVSVGSAHQTQGSRRNKFTIWEVEEPGLRDAEAQEFAAADFELHATQPNGMDRLPKCDVIFKWSLNNGSTDQLMCQGIDI